MCCSFELISAMSHLVSVTLLYRSISNTGIVHFPDFSSICSLAPNIILWVIPFIGHTVSKLLYCPPECPKAAGMLEPPPSRGPFTQSLILSVSRRHQPLTATLSDRAALVCVNKDNFCLPENEAEQPESMLSSRPAEKWQTTWWSTWSLPIPSRESLRSTSTCEWRWKVFFFLLLTNDRSQEQQFVPMCLSCLLLAFM